MSEQEPLFDSHGRHFQLHGGVQMLTRTGQPGAMLDTITDAGGPYRSGEACDVLVQVNDAHFSADFVLTPEGAEALAAILQLAAATARLVAVEAPKHAAASAARRAAVTQALRELGSS